MSKALPSVVDPSPQSYCEQSKTLVIYLAENEHVQIDDKKCEVIKTSQSYNLVDLLSDLIAIVKILESFYSHYINISVMKLPKSFSGNKHILMNMVKKGILLNIKRCLLIVF